MSDLFPPDVERNLNERRVDPCPTNCARCANDGAAPPEPDEAEVTALAAVIDSAWLRWIDASAAEIVNDGYADNIARAVLAAGWKRETP